MLKVVRVKKAQSAPSLPNLLFSFSLFTAALMIAVIATYPAFFLFNPFASIDGWRMLFLTLTSLGWLTAIVGPIVVTGLFARGKVNALRYLPYVALAWPAALIVNHISLVIQTHKLYTGYLFVYPIFLITDIALPLLYVAISTYMNHHHGVSSVGLEHGKNSETA